MQYPFGEECDGYWRVEGDEVGGAGKQMCESEYLEKGRDSGSGFSSHFNGWTLNQGRKCICDKTASGRGRHLRSGPRRSH